MMEECDVISVVTEFMVGSRLGSWYDGGAHVLLSEHTITFTITLGCLPVQLGADLSNLPTTE
jgi:hypothetical protein